MSSTPEERAKRAAYMREWNSRNKERLNRERRERHANDPEFHERMKQSNLKSMEKRGSEAVKAEQAAKYQKHGHKYRARIKEQYDVDPSVIKANNKKWRDANPEKVAACKKAWAEQDRVKHPDKHKAKALANEAWRKKDRLENPAKYAAQNGNRRAKRLKRTPPWADMDAINFFYECCPAGCEVDHAIPLCGEKISGLHVAENLQWLPISANRVKNNNWNST